MGGVIAARNAYGWTPPEEDPEDPPPPTPTLRSTPWLAFDMPLQAVFDASDVVVGPHAMATWRRAVQDKNIVTDATAYEKVNWFPPGGIEGSTNHRVWGGFIRNQSIARNPLGTIYMSIGAAHTGSPSGPVVTTPPHLVGMPDGTYIFSLQDKIWECQQIKAAGMNHVFIDILGDDTFPHVVEWGRAAMLTGIKAVAMPDASVGVIRSGVANTIVRLKELFNGPYATGWHKHSDGRWLIAPYAPELAKGGKGGSVGGVAATDANTRQFWIDVLSGMVSGVTAPTALWCCFTRAWTDASEFTAATFNHAALAPYVVGFGRWGVSDSGGTISTGASNAVSSHATYGKSYLYTRRVEDSRPKSGGFYECSGWENNERSWEFAQHDDMDMIQIATWNDWFEGSGMAPSLLHGYSAIDTQVFHVCEKRLGYTPPIIRDTLYLAHRIHNEPLTAPQPSYASNPYNSVYTTKMSNKGGTPGKNIIDVLVYPTADCTIEITDAGVTTTHDVVANGRPQRVFQNMGTGAGNRTISCRMKRGGVTVPSTEITSPFLVNYNTQLVQDLTYRRMSSRR